MLMYVRQFCIKIFQFPSPQKSCLLTLLPFSPLPRERGLMSCVNLHASWGEGVKIVKLSYTHYSF